MEKIICFENIKKVLTEVELLEKLEKSRKQAVQGMFRDADIVSCNMRKKYELQDHENKVY